jgi:hypothetical protein
MEVRAEADRLASSEQESHSAALLPPVRNASVKERYVLQLANELR